VSAIINQVFFRYFDINGDEAFAMMRTQNQDAGPASAFAPLGVAFQNCSDAGLKAIQFQSTLIIDNSPASGAYCTVFDRGVLRGRYVTTNQSVKIPIIGPKATILKPGNIEIDIASPLVAALQTQCQAVLGDANGHNFGTFVYGNRKEVGST